MPKKERYTREMPTGMEMRQVNEADRTVELSFSSETPVFDPVIGVSEILSHDPDAVDLSRLNSIGVLLFNHDRDEVIGKILSAGIDEATMRGIATVQFDTDPESELIWQKVVSGTLKGVSVSYTVQNWESVASGSVSSNGRFSGPVDVATRWTPYEISIVSVPADANVGVGRSEPIIIGEEEKVMNEEQKIVTPVTEPIDTASIIEAERQRAATITALCAEFGLDATNYIQKGASIEEVQREALAKQKAERSAVPNVEVTRDAVDNFIKAAADGLLLRGQRPVETPSKEARDYAKLSLRDIAIDALERSGVSGAHRLSNDQLLQRALTPGSAFANILDNAANASMIAAYDQGQLTWRQWCKIGSLNDFKPSPAYRISEAGQMQYIAENGEFKWSQLKDEGITRQLKTYGIKFGLTYQAFVNDDIGFVTEYPVRYVRAALREINRQVYGILNTNPTIYDGTALFAAGHNNLNSGGAGVISNEKIAAGRAAMRKQLDIDGVTPINVTPSFLIAPPELETAARQYTQAVLYPSAATNANVYQGTLAPIIDADLTNATAWYLAADPTQCAGIEVDFLNGNTAPVLESQVGWATLGMEWRIYYAFGVTVVDYRALQKNAGA